MKTVSKEVAIARSTMIRKIKDTKGQIFSVQFVKKDGQTRDMNCRLGVSKYVKGTGTSLPLPKYVRVFDLQVHGYRLVNKETIKRAVISGTTYNIR